MQLTVEDMDCNPCVTVSTSYVDVMALDNIGRHEFNEQEGYSEVFLLCDKQDGHRLENSEAINAYDVLSKIRQVDNNGAGERLFVRIITAGNIVISE